MSDEKAMKQLALRLAAHLKRRGHAVPFEVLTHVLAALRGFTNWHVFLKAKDRGSAPLKLTEDLTYFVDTLTEARLALTSTPKAGEPHEPSHRHRQMHAILRIDDALAALKARAASAEAQVPGSTLVAVKSASDSAALREKRGKAADRAYEHYEFGPGVSVEDDDGWESRSDEPALWRTVYVRFADRQEDSSTKLTFHVRFAAASDQITEVFALDSTGSHWGQSDTRVQKDAVVATYDYKHGNTVRIFESEAAALAWRTQIALDYWDEMFADEESYGPKPEAGLIGERYFELMREGAGYVESFDLTFTPIES